MSTQHLQEKWEPILNHQDLPEITDPYRKAVTAQLLENQERFLREQSAMGVSNGLLTENIPNSYSYPVDGPPTNNVNPAGQVYTGADGQVAPVNSIIGDPVAGYSGYADHRGPVAGFDPVLISLIRRSMPNLLAYDICGVQPMSGPTGMIFAMRSLYDGPMGPNEALFDEPDPTFSSAWVLTRHYLTSPILLSLLPLVFLPKLVLISIVTMTVPYNRNSLVSMILVAPSMVTERGMSPMTTYLVVPGDPPMV
jgi:hypothetical protein